MTTHEVVLPLFSGGASVDGKPTKRYRTLVADPPWRYTARQEDPTHQGRTQYPTMTQAELLCLPIGLWAEPDAAHLYLWTTNNFLVDAFQLVKAWGFEYKTMLTWIKRHAPEEEDEETGEPGPRDDHWIGMGNYYRGVTEHVLFAIRGRLPVREHGKPNIFYAPHRGHSEKPDAFYSLMASMSPGPYADVFARKQRWVGEVNLEVMDTFGDQCFNFGTSLPPEHFTGAGK